MRKLVILLGIFAICQAVNSQVVPIINPHVTFVDASGAPCAGCSLYSYVAGTTTPQATYVDSGGVTQNPNPIVLDASGGPQTPSGSTGGIWFGRLSYKLVLKSATGATIWTADNITASSVLPCGPANTIQISNAALNGLNCDSSITINTVNHTLNVGTLTPAHVTIGALGTATSWTFDTTSPATAAASLGLTGTVSDGAGTTTANQLALSTTTAHQLQYATAIPNGTTATTQTAGDNSTKVATTAYVAAPGAIGPTSLAVNGGTAITGNQGNGTLVQHSTGAVTSGNCAKFDANGNVIDAGALCGGPTTSKTCNANGCYRIEADGTIEAWGQSTGVGSPTSAANLTITFPTTFTATTHLQLVVSATSNATGDGNPHPADCHVTMSTLTTSGATVVIAAPTQIGGSGYSNLAGGDYCSWHAYGD